MKLLSFNLNFDFIIYRSFVSWFHIYVIKYGIFLFLICQILKKKKKKIQGTIIKIVTYIKQLITKNNCY